MSCVTADICMNISFVNSSEELFLACWYGYVLLWLRFSSVITVSVSVT